MVVLPYVLVDVYFRNIILLLVLVLSTAALQVPTVKMSSSTPDHSCSRPVSAGSTTASSPRSVSAGSEFISLLAQKKDPVLVWSQSPDVVGQMLSNFWPCEIVYEDRRFPSVEHAYHAMKASDDDHEQREEFRDVFTSGTEQFCISCGEKGSAAKVGRLWEIKSGPHTFSGH